MSLAPANDCNKMWPGEEDLLFLHFTPESPHKAPRTGMFNFVIFQTTYAPPKTPPLQHGQGSMVGVEQMDFNMGEVSAQRLGIT